MATTNGNTKKHRTSRTAKLTLPPGSFEHLMTSVTSRETALRLGMCLLAAIIMWSITGAGKRPFSYRRGYVPERGILARYSFDVKDEKRTIKAREQAESQAHRVYTNDPEAIVQLREQLKNKVVVLMQPAAKGETHLEIWREFKLPESETDPGADPGAEPVDEQKQLEQFIALLMVEGALDAFKQGLDEALAPLEQHGLLAEPPPTNEGNQEEIFVHLPDKPNSLVRVSDVHMGEAIPKLHDKLQINLKPEFVSQRVFAWLSTRLKPTLSFDSELTELEKGKAVDLTEEILQEFNPGDLLAAAGHPLDVATRKLLREEYDSPSAQPAIGDRISRSLAMLGMFAALYSLCGLYIYLTQHELLNSLSKLATLLALATVAVMFSWFLGEQSRAELIPLLLFGMTVCIAFHRELALLLSAAVSLVIVFTLGHSIADFVILVASSSAAVLLLGRIRSRRKLIYVGLAAGAVVVTTTIGVNTMQGQPPAMALLDDAAWCGLWVVVAAFLMTGLLPFIESLFGVQTDLSLIELGDVAHPLLQELVRRAPGTYNHSINVASIAEAAAESIGAHGLLVRVGAYFHDIGKMLKPRYFVENQGEQGNRHETLMPAMSTLIIIAHVKDGADLARQHHLPKAIIDFIQQHHGTTLVEYFYDRATEQSQSDPDQSEVDEANYRYPGPKPQTKEAAVLMLADGVESASRTLVEPTPARIESLVHDMALKRLLDGQFDACDLTLCELRTIEQSLIKSLTAVYHGRVKYPDQRTA